MVRNEPRTRRWRRRRGRVTSWRLVVVGAVVVVEAADSGRGSGVCASGILLAAGIFLADDITCLKIPEEVMARMGPARHVGLQQQFTFGPKWLWRLLLCVMGVGVGGGVDVGGGVGVGLVWVWVWVWEWVVWVWVWASICVCVGVGAGVVAGVAALFLLV